TIGKELPAHRIVRLLLMESARHVKTPLVMPQRFFRIAGESFHQAELTIAFDHRPGAFVAAQHSVGRDSCPQSFLITCDGVSRIAKTRPEWGTLEVPDLSIRL